MFEKLVAAIADNKAKEVRELIEKDRNLVTHVDTKGSTPLHYAVHLNKSEIVNVLISLGAIVDQQDNSGRTPLHWGIEKKVNVEIITKLIEKGADINKPSGVSKNTPLHYAAQCGNTEAMKILLDKGANVQVVNAKGLAISDVCKDRATGQALGDLLRGADAQKYQKMLDAPAKQTASKQK